MKRETISLALNGLEDTFISEAAEFCPEGIQETPERIARMKTKRIISIALAAALILALGVTAYAIAGMLRSTARHNMPENGEFTSLSELKTVERTVGYPLTVPESFSNGFAFSRLRVDGTADYDENGEILREYYCVNVNYTNPNAAEVLLDLSPVKEGSVIQGDDIRQIDGVDVSFQLDTYKYVPENYEKTEADIAAEEGGHFFITYGPGEITESQVASVAFDLDGVRYTLIDLAANGNSLETLGQMAGELIAASHG